VLRVPFPIPSNVVPLHCGLGSYVSTCFSPGIHRFSPHRVQPHRLVFFPGLGHRHSCNRGDSPKPEGFTRTHTSDCCEGCRFRCCSARCPCSRSQVNGCIGGSRYFTYTSSYQRVLYVLMMYVSVCKSFLPRARPFGLIPPRPDRHECPLNERIRREFAGCIRGRR